ncbi:MAG: TolC family protein, partial [Chthoniobacterales bacterium]|nr:TolC family protein [Chthoniobacterales bacterium]
MLVVDSGCTPERYRKSADLQVQRLIKDRERKTLDYTPQVDAEVRTPDRPTKEAYVRIPTTPKQPATQPAIEPSDPVVPFGTLGPEPSATFPNGVMTPAGSIDLSAIQQRIDQRLQLGPPSPGDEPLRLDLFGSIAYAVRNSRQYKSQMESLYISALDVTTERHLFSPRPFARTGLRYTASESPNEFESAVSVVNRIGVRQQLPYGGDLTAEALVNFVNTLEDNVENSQPASVALSASIPLLRGAGMVNLEPLIDAERSLIYQVRTFEDFRRSFAVNVSSFYFDLLAQQQQIANALQNLQNTRRFTEQAQALYAAGIQRFIDVQRALQSQLQAENSLVNAQNEYQGSLDQFKLLIGAPTDEPIEVVARELAVLIPSITEETAVEWAQKYRLDLRTAEDQVEDARRNVRNAKNNLLPELDLVTRATLGDTANSLLREGNADDEEYSAELTLDLPIDRVIERNSYRRSLINLERTQREYEQLHDEVAIDARDALRGIRTAEMQVRIQRSSVELA